MNFTETILLVEPDNQAVRTMAVTQRGVYEVIERLHLDPLNPATVTIRLWRNKDNEKDLTGALRVFREVVPELPKEPDEQPLYDELVLKDPIPFHEDETPLGWRRKHLRKES